MISVITINQSEQINKQLSDIDLVTRVEAVLYLKGRPITKKDLSEITNSDINSINDAIKELRNKYSNPNSAIELNEISNSCCLELKSILNDFVEDLLPSELKTSELRTLATIAIKKKILQSDLILLRGSGAYDHIKELLDKKFIVKRKQKDGRSFWLTLSEKFFQTFAVSNEYLSKIGSRKDKQQ
ncbi:SMC-Scp complex subunit ScpB [Prochlorococcus marinus]|uniref:SMC-Scp complex subunit ScpB n=1 Tax=Prochlorococcus marinus TaxID=1219 RepID=UPI001ADC7474|nr:SMC-Scp complex subunit ScpB [Prochlorococcus marinus]MBO8204484.1 SMC-Scp complex subunit ScpB [Prochlorococcus marinus CUG1415]MBW3043778.1 SMC-Scp complex subunit ScpB [Prochlorococcus marinus str. MU1415]